MIYCSKLQEINQSGAEVLAEMFKAKLSKKKDK